MPALTDQEQQQLNQLLNAAGKLLAKAGRDELTIEFIPPNPTGKALPAIFLNTVPKSGSMFIRDVLRSALCLRHVRIAGGYFPNDAAMRTWLDRLNRGSGIAQEHLPATYINRVVLSRRLDRMILNVRDPRQATLSWTHHVRTLLKENRQDELAMIDPPLPTDYFSWSLSEQIDWQIDHHLPLLIQWIDQWIDAESDPAFTPKLLVTRFEDFKADKHAFFQRILDFYDLDAAWLEIIDKVLAQFTDLKQRQANFRKGKTDEWREVFTPAQADRASSMISSTITERFGYHAGAASELAA